MKFVVILQPYTNIHGCGDALMFIDDAVIAGLLTVGLMVVFLAGVGVFIYQDARKTSKKSS